MKYCNSVIKEIIIKHQYFNNDRSNAVPNSTEIVIVVVSCGMRQQETLNLLKSAIIFGFEHRLKFIVMTEDSLMTGFREKLEDWSSITKNKFTFQVLPLIFPKENEAEWRNLFKPCAAQRLFLPVSTKKPNKKNQFDCLFLLICFILGNSHRY